MKLNRYEKKIIGDMVDNRKGIYGDDLNEIDQTINITKVWRRSFFVYEKVDLCRDTNELEFRTATLVWFRWFTCKLYRLCNKKRTEEIIIMFKPDLMIELPIWD